MHIFGRDVAERREITARALGQLAREGRRAAEFFMLVSWGRETEEMLVERSGLKAEDVRRDLKWARRRFRTLLQEELARFEAEQAARRPRAVPSEDFAANGDGPPKREKP